MTVNVIMEIDTKSETAHGILLDLLTTYGVAVGFTSRGNVEVILTLDDVDSFSEAVELADFLVGRAIGSRPLSVEVMSTEEFDHRVSSAARSRITLISEHGPEILDAPAGSKIIPLEES